MESNENPVVNLFIWKDEVGIDLKIRRKDGSYSRLQTKDHRICEAIDDVIHHITYREHWAIRPTLDNDYCTALSLFRM